MKKITKYIVISVALLCAYPVFTFLKEVKYLLYGDNSYEMQLILAARTNDIPKAEMLLKKGANVNAVKSFKTSTTPLVAAIQFGRIEMVDFLLKHGAKTSFTFKNSNYDKGMRWLLNKLNLAISEYGQPHTWYFLDEAMSIALGRHEISGGDVPPWGQVQKNQHEIVRALLNAGAQSSEYYPLLAAAIFAGDLNLVKQMLNDAQTITQKQLLKKMLSGVSPQTYTQEQLYTILRAIAWSGNKEMLDYLLSALPQLKNPEQRNLLLHSIVESNYPEMLEYVLAKPGFNVNAPDERVIAPLDLTDWSFTVSKENSQKMKEILLHHGARHSAKYLENATE